MKKETEWQRVHEVIMEPDALAGAVGNVSRKAPGFVIRFDGTSTPNKSVDPYLAWAMATNFRFIANDGGWIRIILQVAEHTPDGKLYSAQSFSRSMVGNEWIRIPPAYFYPACGLNNSRFLTAAVSSEFFQQLQPGGFLEGRIAKYEISASITDSSTDNSSGTGDSSAYSMGDENHAHRQGQKSALDQLYLQLQEGRLKKAAVPVVAIIDHSIAFLNSSFRQKPANNKTRFLSFWNQDTRSSDGLTQHRPDAGYGQVVSMADINKHLASGNTETDIYSQLNYKLACRRNSHGTGVADLAAGNHESDCPLVGVQLPTYATGLNDTSGYWLSAATLDALRFTLDTIDAKWSSEFSQPSDEHNGEMLAPPPVIVNLSMGNLAGPHDGSSLLEEAMDELLLLRQSAGFDPQVNIAAGNARLDRCHAMVRLAPGESKTFSWRILPDDSTPSFMELWLPLQDRDSTDDIEVTVTPPGGASVTLRKGQSQVLKGNHQTEGGGVQAMLIYTDRNSLSSGNSSQVLLAISPTRRTPLYKEKVPAGDWQIELVNNCSVGTCEVQAWIQRDETAAGDRGRGRQTYFYDPVYETALRALGPADRQCLKDGKVTGSNVKLPADCYVTHENTLNAAATGRMTAIVGSIDVNGEKISPYSAEGGIVGAQSKFVDNYAYGDVSSNHPGLRCSDGLSGSVQRLSGTSAATAVYTRSMLDDYLQPKKDDRVFV